ncbi:MAG TPA: hypothetical protein VII44_10955 [Puia sp.]
MNLIKRKNLLLFSLAAETFLASYGLVLGEQTTIVSILYLMAALIFIFSILLLPSARFPRVSDLKKESLLKLPFLVFMLLLAFITSRYWLDLIPLDPDFADMLPVMKVMNERFLHGNLKQVYDPIPEIWNGTLPIYLPAMWLPYASAVALHVDMRWVTVVSVLLSFIAILILIRIKKNKYYGYSLITITALLFWWIFSRNEVHSLISMSEEGVVIFYFVLLSMAIISGNAFFMGLTASLCLLSRYSMIGWLVPCLLFLTVRKDFRKLIIFSATGIVCLLLLFLFPFGFKTLEQMIALPENYVAFAKHVWEYSPEVYWLNLGLAKFYGPHGITFLHYSLLILSFGIPFLFMCFCLLQKKWHFQNINLACFKLSLLVFYQFIDVPYGYLFYTYSFVSLMIASTLLSVEVR